VKEVQITVSRREYNLLTIGCDVKRDIAVFDLFAVLKGTTATAKTSNGKHKQQCSISEKHRIDLKLQVVAEQFARFINAQTQPHGRHAYYRPV
jgi:hypothetical protein